MLADPRFMLPEHTRRLLEDCVRASVLGTPSPLAARQRIALSDELATAAAWALLRQLQPHHQVIDANHLRRNQPGYDFLIDGRVRLQLKGGTFVESIGWAHTPDPRAADLDFDILLAVDMGVTLDGRVGRLACKPIPVQEAVVYYVVPGDIVRSWVTEGRRINKRGAHIYLYKYPLKKGCKEEYCQTYELATWRNRFDVLKAALV